MTTSDVLTIIGLILSFIIPVSSAVWYLLTHPKDKKKIILTAILTVLIVSLLGGGVLFAVHIFSPGGGQTGNTLSSFHQKAPGCEVPDPQIDWTTNHARLQCQGGITLLTKIGSFNGDLTSQLGQLILRSPSVECRKN